MRHSQMVRCGSLAVQVVVRTTTPRVFWWGVCGSDARVSRPLDLPTICPRQGSRPTKALAGFFFGRLGWLGRRFQPIAKQTAQAADGFWRDGIAREVPVKFWQKDSKERRTCIDLSLHSMAWLRKNEHAGRDSVQSAGLAFCTLQHSPKEFLRC